jgi:phosphate:Na+ symporter
MSRSFDIWTMLAGIAFFLLAMNFIENSLKRIAGRKFKLVLKKQSDNTLKAIGGAAVVTGLLQSSSIVNLLVLSMVGAHVLQMQNALALILGANLGSTLSGWIVALAGFNYDLETLVLPVAAISGIFMAFIRNDSKLFLWLKFLFGLAFLFVALGFIKSGMEGYVKQTDLSSFIQYPVIVFLLLGILLTALIQSSSATVVLTLSALYAGAIPLFAATAIVLGSELGTTFKLFLASADGMAAKKRVALGNFIFNAVTVIIVFIFLRPVNGLITDVLQVKNPLISLVVFQTFVNLCSVILFLPLLKFLGKYLLKRYPERAERSLYIHKVPAGETVFALEALENETRHFINLVLQYSLASFSVKGKETNDAAYREFHNKSIEGKYDFIKQLHGELHNFYLKVQNEASEKVETERIERLISAVRNIMYAAKNINDTQYDIRQFSNSSNDIKYNFYNLSAGKFQHFCKAVETLLNRNRDDRLFEHFSTLYYAVSKGYSQSLQLLYRDVIARQLSEIEITTFINFNREMYTAFKSLLYGLKDYLLTPSEAAHFDSLPGFIR